MANGLTNKEVIEQRKKYGSNEISRQKQKSIFKLFIESLGDPIIKILLIALGMKTIFLFHDFDWFETLGILIAILIASLISTVSEYGSETVFKKLQETSSKLKCKVIREKKIKEYTKLMKEAAANLEFETAVVYRDKLKELERLAMKNL